MDVLGSICAARRVQGVKKDFCGAEKRFFRSLYKSRTLKKDFGLGDSEIKKWTLNYGKKCKIKEIVGIEYEFLFGNFGIRVFDPDSPDGGGIRSVAPTVMDIFSYLDNQKSYRALVCTVGTAVLIYPRTEVSGQIREKSNFCIDL